MMHTVTGVRLEMKKYFYFMAILAAVSAGAQSGVFLRPSTNEITVPFINPIGFTNSLGLTNESLEMSNLTEVLLDLQTNVEEALPALSEMTSNATVAVSANQPQASAPVVPGPASPFLAPTGRPNPVQQTLISVTLGTNTFTMDQATFRAVATLQDDLAGMLPVLQALNGTTVTNVNTNLNNSTAAFTKPFEAITTPFPGLTNRFILPMTNQSSLGMTPF